MSQVIELPIKAHSITLTGLVDKADENSQLEQLLHDIKSPLAALEAALSDGAQGPANTQLLYQAQQRLDRLVKKYEERSLPQSRPQTSPCELLDMLERLREEKISTLGDSCGATIEFRKRLPGPRSISLKLCSSELERILSNLLNNSLEACSHNPTNDGRIEISLQWFRHYLEIEIFDNGKGIPSHVLDQLACRGLSFHKPSGRGLGLTHARNALSENGGDLSIKSVWGKETKVTLRIAIN